MLTQENNKCYIRHMHFNNELICSVENGSHNQEDLPSTIKPSEFKRNFHGIEITSNPTSNEELTSKSVSGLQVHDAIKETFDLVPDKYYLENFSTMHTQSEQKI